MWWLTIFNGDRVDGWQLRDRPTDDQIIRARVIAGFPAGDEWIHSDQLPQRIYLAEAETVHDSLTTRATWHPSAGLAAVPTATVDAYRLQQTASGRQSRIDAARDMLRSLTADERAVVIAEVGGSTPKPTAGRF